MREMEEDDDNLYFGDDDDDSLFFSLIDKPNKNMALLDDYEAKELHFDYDLDHRSNLCFALKGEKKRGGGNWRSVAKEGSEEGNVCIDVKEMEKEG